jgi:hypothetical protein
MRRSREQEEVKKNKAQHLSSVRGIYLERTKVADVSSRLRAVAGISLSNAGISSMTLRYST